MNSTQSSVSPVLYKYLNADRLDVLTNCRIRFSQRSVFHDDHELQPDYDSYGTVDQIRKQLQSVRTCPWWMPIDLLALKIAISPKHQQTALQTAVKNIKSIDQMGILCLTVAAQSEQMWNEYAQGGTGFLISFDTTHVGFRKMTAPMGIHKVTYSGEGFPTFLGMVETNPFEPLYRKRLNYSYEQEWRSLRLLKDLEPHPNNVFLASLDPRSILEIVIRSACAVGPQIRDIVAHDGRYHHVRIVTA